MKTLDQIPPTWSQKLPAAQRFELVYDGAGVLDKETGLVWEQAPNMQQRYWVDAVAACAAKTVGDRMGWHLPTFEQLASLVDPTNVSPNGPALPSGHPFIEISMGDPYHSSTTFTAYLSGPDTPSIWARSVHFRYASTIGIGLEYSAASYGHVWCVRGGQSRDVP
jgi:hypothetical protein